MAASVRLLAVGLAALAVSGTAVAARVPTGVSSIRIRSATGLTTTVTLRANVQEIVKAFGALRRLVARPCSYDSYAPPDVTFDFRAANGSVVLHALDHAPGTCNGSITYTTHGNVKHAPLADAGFVARVATMLGGDIDPSARTVANARLAKREARQLLRLEVAPPGSRRLSTLPRTLSVGGTPPVVASQVDVTRIWKVRMSVDAAFAFERSHQPQGSKITNISMSSWRKHRWDPLTVSKRLAFSFRGVRHRVSLRQLNVAVVSLRRGWTAIEIDAQAVWVVARAPDEVVPIGVKTIEIRKGSLLVHRVTARPAIATIIRWFDALPLARLGACGPAAPIRGAFERIAFLDGSGHVVARATAYPYGRVSGECTPIAFGIRGHGFPSLLGGRFLIRVENLLR